MLITPAGQLSMELVNRAKSTLATLTVPMGRLNKRCMAKSIVSEETHMVTAKIPMDSPLQNLTEPLRPSQAHSSIALKAMDPKGALTTDALPSDALPSAALPPDALPFDAPHR